MLAIPLEGPGLLNVEKKIKKEDGNARKLTPCEKQRRYLSFLTTAVSRTATQWTVAVDRADSAVAV